MNLKSFLKEKIIYILILLFIQITCEIFLMIYNINILIKIYIGLAPLIGFIIAIAIEYKIKSDFYKQLNNNLEDLKDKYLISEIIKTPSFIEGKVLKQVIQETGKSMIDNVNKYKYILEDYKEYIELWIHEIKIPIATSKMIIENYKTKETKSINEELEKVEGYIEQALYYARSNTVEKDYYISKSNLEEIVNQTIIKNKNLLISNKISLQINDIKKEVYTDSKWTIFILNQIIQNSIKYMDKENKIINIYAKDKKDRVILYIKDNGMGVKKGEITRVFEKGFTGENGRQIGKKSTGIGLYLCKKLCDKLGLGIEFNSNKDEGSIVNLVFPKSSFTNI